MRFPLLIIATLAACGCTSEQPMVAVNPPSISDTVQPTTPVLVHHTPAPAAPEVPVCPTHIAYKPTYVPVQQHPAAIEALGKAWQKVCGADCWLKATNLQFAHVTAAYLHRHFGVEADYVLLNFDGTYRLLVNGNVPRTPEEEAELWLRVWEELLAECSDGKHKRIHGKKRKVVIKHIVKFIKVTKVVIHG